MTQKIFDTDNEEDMELLWSILPEEIYKIGKNVTDYTVYWRKGQEYPSVLYELNIDLHNKKEITRPVNYEDMIGCVGWFWDDRENCLLGRLEEYYNGDDFPFSNGDNCYKNFRPAKKAELKFWGE
jgi:hypothetical protein